MPFCMWVDVAKKKRADSKSALITIDTGLSIKYLPALLVFNLCHHRRHCSWHPCNGTLWVDRSHRYWCEWMPAQSVLKSEISYGDWAILSDGMFNILQNLFMFAISLSEWQVNCH